VWVHNQHDKPFAVYCYYARQIALERGYSVLTGKGIFRETSQGHVDFNRIIFNPTPHYVSVERYSRWFASLVNRAVVFLGPTRSTAEIEEEELGKLKTPTAGVAVIEKYFSGQDCSRLKVRRGAGFSVCRGSVGECEKEKYCPFGKKGKGVPYGRLDFYCRIATMHLVAVRRKERIMDAIAFIALI